MITLFLNYFVSIALVSTGELS